MRLTATRYHDISCGHRVAGHESKCQHLHGHNYRITFTCQAEPGAFPLDQVGRVMDFSVIKQKLCVWLEDKWDHAFLAWENDPLMHEVLASATVHGSPELETMLGASIVWVPFNPTAENMADYLLRVVCLQQLAGTGVRVIKVVVEETRKCAAEAHYE